MTGIKKLMLGVAVLAISGVVAGSALAGGVTLRASHQWPGANALWFMYEPILMSKKSWDKLDGKQQAALKAAGEKAEEFFFGAAKGLDDKLVDTYKKAGVKVVSMSKAQHAAWVATAKASSYKIFSEKVPGWKELIEKALSVE